MKVEKTDKKGENIQKEEEEKKIGKKTKKEAEDSWKSNTSVLIFISHISHFHS